MEFKSDPDKVELLLRQPFEYALYPFEQGSERSLEDLGIRPTTELVARQNDTFDQPFEYDGPEEDTPTEHWMECDWGQLTLYHTGTGRIMCEDGVWGLCGRQSVVYRICDSEGRIVGGFRDYQTTYQMGDCVTNFYEWEGRLVVQNCGDVSSVVVIQSIQ